MSVPGKEVASSIAARSVQTPLPGAVSQTPLPGKASSASAALLTTMVDLTLLVSASAAAARTAARSPTPVLSLMSVVLQELLLGLTRFRSLLKVAVDVEDELDGPGGLVAEHVDVAGGPERDDRVVRARLRRPIVDRRDQRKGRSSREETQIARGRRFGHRHVDGDRPGARRNAAGSGEDEVSRRARGKCGAAQGPGGSA